ncbi:MAG TPA: zinc ABC transporter substrate-binding protein [Actinomycetota bacterium]|nr:zinc ABC transporter substrate-binding protein [Actinomycetota bacterium]
MRISLNLRQGVGAVAASVFLVGCVSAAESERGRTTVAAGFYPLAELARAVGGPRVEVTDITPPGAEPHDLELTAEQVAEIQSADLVLYLGTGFQPAVEAAVGEAQGRALDLLEGLGVRSSIEDEFGVDEHVWLDPVLMMDMTDRVARALGRVDPGGRATFEAKAERFRADLAALDQAYREGLADCDRRTIVVSHAAFQYLTERYGLRQEAISGLSPEAEPDPARLAELSDLVRREGVTVVFTEELVSPEVAETLARETGVETDVLSPIEGLTEEQMAAGQDYLSVMEHNLSKLRAALGCR